MTDAPTHRRHELVGIALVLAATAVWSMTGFFTRALSTDVWTTLAGRSAFGFVILTTIFVARNGLASWKVMRSMGRWGVAHAAASVVCALATITSLYETSVANNAVIGATAPFAAALLARVFLGERVPLRTLVAGAVALAGVAVVVSGSLGGGRLRGDLLAVAMMLSFATMIVVSRARPTMPVAPPNILAVAANFVVTAPLADFGRIGAPDAALLAAFGVTNFVLAGTLFLAGSRRIPATDSALLVALDIVFGPALVWAVFAEAPTTAGIVGGAVVFVAVAGNVLLGRDRRRT